ncbi:MAG TPA: carbohydrate ABC transporter permease [Clostridiales bacterium]|nr:carbohydrate ABC transporter permease [Clostridiales bacterium]
MIRKSNGYKVFLIFNYIFLFVLAVLCIFPVIHVLALSMSSSTAAASGKVVIFPVEFNLKSYKFVMENNQFLRAFFISVVRVGLGVPVNMLLTVLSAYPLSRPKSQFRTKSLFTWFFLITILFSGGLIPWYMVIKETGLLDSIWALVIPGAVPVFNVILLINYFRSIPSEFEEAAYMDGAGHWTILWKIFLPISIPTLATITLFSLLGHWNSWFDGLILMNNPEKYPLQSYMQTIVINRDPNTLTERDLDLLKIVNEKTTKSAQLFIAMIPIICVYPFLQRYFTTGLVVGGIKG